MLRCDSRRFWQALRKYVQLHLEEEFPVEAQEAYIMFMDKAPEEKRMMLPVKEDIFKRYKLFWEDLENKAKPGMTLEKVGEEMRKDWGDTYWWYNLFGRKVPVINGNIGHEVHS
jgi:CRISPR/Cas system endoribonuclease Cas6 (RAMP superfamily)